MSCLPLKFLLFILKFRGAKGFEDTILPPETRGLVTAIRGGVRGTTPPTGNAARAGGPGSKGPTARGALTARGRGPVHPLQATENWSPLEPC